MIGSSDEEKESKIHYRASFLFEQNKWKSKETSSYISRLVPSISTLFGRPRTHPFSCLHLSFIFEFAPFHLQNENEGRQNLINISPPQPPLFRHWYSLY